MNEEHYMDSALSAVIFLYQIKPALMRSDISYIVRRPRTDGGQAHPKLYQARLR